MTNKIISGECSSCESSYHIEYTEELVSEELPEHCPFCGELIDQITYIEEEDDLDDDDKWD